MITRIRLLAKGKIMNGKNWYYDGSQHHHGDGLMDFDALEDFTEEEKLEVKALMEKLKAEAPAEFVYEEPDLDHPFGAWNREKDEFGGTYVMLLPAHPSDGTPADREFIADMALWAYVNLGTEIEHITPKWSEVDAAIKDLFES